MPTLKQNTHHQNHCIRVDGTYMGIDPSLTATGIGILTPTGMTTINYKTDAGTVKGTTRIAMIVGGLLALAHQHKPRVIAIEGYSLGSVNSQAHSQGELGGVLKMELLKHGYNVFVVPPSNAKQFATGTGKSKGKGPIMLALMKRFGLEIDEDNQADGANLALIAAALDNGLPETKFPAPNLKALGKVEHLTNPFGAVRRR